MIQTTALPYPRREMCDGEIIADSTYCLTCAYRLDRLIASQQCGNCGAVHMNRCPECGGDVKRSVAFRGRLSLSPRVAGRLEDVLGCAATASQFIAVALGIAGAALVAMVLENQNAAVAIGGLALWPLGFGTLLTTVTGCCLAYALVREFNRTIFLSMWPLLYCALLGLSAATIVPSAGRMASYVCLAIGALLCVRHDRRRRALAVACALAALPIALALFQADLFFFVSLWLACPFLCLTTLGAAIRAHCSRYRPAWYERIYPWLAILATVTPLTTPTHAPQPSWPLALYAAHALLLLTAALAALSATKLRRYLNFSSDPNETSLG